ncbi:Cupredoxin [Amylostereum chailletii]|nr:Cupredoxin [Amylostereum chailletii]
MRFFTSFLAASAALVSVVSAANYTVQVGLDNGLTYTPPQLMAQPGDMVSFMFLTKNHTVTQSSFAEPCTSLPGGVDTGFIPVADPNSPTVTAMTMMVNDTNPIWFYCRQQGHCMQGMVFAINPTPAQPYETFQAAAMNTTAPMMNMTAAETESAPSATEVIVQLVQAAEPWWNAKRSPALKREI